MNTQALPETPAQSREVTDVPFARRFYWLVRREIEEHRSIYLVPLVVAGLYVIAFAVGLPRHVATLQQPMTAEGPYTFAALLLMGANTLVAIFYCLDALYGERRDRSILFWKSLPVSDHETVLAKATIPIVIIPLITFVVTFVVQGIMLLMASTRLGFGAWAHLAFGEMTWVLFYHLILGHGFWYAPFWGWLLLASAWAKRAPLLWAAVPLLVLGVLEKIVLNTAYLGSWLGNRLGGAPMTGSAPHQHEAAGMTIASVTPQGWLQFLTSPGFWLGLAVTGIFLLLAVHLRRQRGPN